jgi:hypothetical protein
VHVKRYAKAVIVASTVTTLSVTVPVVVGEAALGPASAEAGCPAGASPYGVGITGSGRPYMECRDGKNNKFIVWLD